MKDLFGAMVFLFVFAIIAFFAPAPRATATSWKTTTSYPADPLKTPEHIAPVWYFTPYYSILRAIPPLFNSQFPGVAAMGLATLIFFLVPWLDRSPVKSIRYRGPRFKRWLTAFVLAFLILGYDLGTVPTNVAGPAGRGWAARTRYRRGAPVRRGVLPLLHSHALVHEPRHREAGTDAGDTLMKKILRPETARSSLRRAGASVRFPAYFAQEVRR